jgi:cysteine desulfurase / selenocysteine lyase
MKKPRRDFLRTISSAAAFSGVAPLLPPEQQTNGVRSHFPLLADSMNGHPLVYLDSAATTQRPRAVLDALNNFYLHENANPSLSLHELARHSASLYDEARATVARFITAHGPDEIVFTRGTTEAINLVASSWGQANLRSGDEILLTICDHYSNLVPWQLAAQRSNATLRVLDVRDDGHLRLDQLDTLLSKKTKIVTFPHVSNVLGAITPAKQICERAHKAGAVVLIDAAQSVPHFPVDVQELGCDFLAFSGHKMCGPMGIGALWARRELLDAMPPFQSGSNMAHEVSIQSVPHFAEGGLKFEAGTPNVPGAIGLAAATQFLDSLGRKQLWKTERELTRYALSRFATLKQLRLLGPTNPEERISVFTFALENHKPLEVARALDQLGIAVRAGDLASLPLLTRLGTDAALRASCYIYTTPAEIDRLADGLEQVLGVAG